MNQAVSKAKEDRDRACAEFLFKCQHDEGFFCTIIVPPDAAEYPAVFMCKIGCGYWLGFDPGKFPEGVKYTPVPALVKATPKLSTGGKF